MEISSVVNYFIYMCMVLHIQSFFILIYWNVTCIRCDRAMSKRYEWKLDVQTKSIHLFRFLYIEHSSTSHHSTPLISSHFKCALVFNVYLSFVFDSNFNNRHTYHTYHTRCTLAFISNRGICNDRSIDQFVQLYTIVSSRIVFAFCIHNMMIMTMCTSHCYIVNV